MSCTSMFTITDSMTTGTPMQVQFYIKTPNGGGVSYDVDNLSLRLVPTPPSRIIVPATVKNGWGVGAEILITSHTLDYRESQVRTIQLIRNHGNGNFVVLELDSPITRPTTVMDDPKYAVEVALLSRNILFEGAKDDTADHGAHLIVMQTKGPQHIEGVELRNFGQQGLLGRYVSDLEHFLERLER